MNTSFRWLASLLLASAFLLPTACDRQKLIPNSKIPDTKGNREILKVLVGYRDAMVHKDAAKILTLVDPRYEDNAGTPEPEDDVDYERLKTILVGRFKHVTHIHYRIEFQRIKVKGREALIDTWIDATFVYKLPNYRPHYKRFADYNRYRLLRQDGHWRFISGL